MLWRCGTYFYVAPTLRDKVEMLSMALIAILKHVGTKYINTLLKLDK